MKRCQKLIGVVLVFALLGAGTGCSLLGGAQQKQGPTEDDVKDMIKEEMQAPETTALVEQTVSKTAGEVRAEDLLTSPDTQKVMEEQIKKLLATPDMQKALGDQMKQTLQSPEMQTAISEAVKQALMNLLQGKSGGGQSGQGGGQSGQSGGQSGGKSGSGGQGT